MSKKSVEKYQRRVDSLSAYISHSSKTEKVKQALIDEYIKGNFYEIPLEYLNDKTFIETLKRHFFNSKAHYQRVPTSLFSSGSIIELLVNVAAKYEKGIIVNFEDLEAYIDKNPYNKNLMDIFKKSILYKALQNNSEQYKTAMLIETMPFYIKMHTLLRKELDDSERQLYVAKQKEEYRQKDKELFRKTLQEQKDSKGRLSVIRENQLYEIFKTIYSSKFKLIELETSKFIDAELREYLNSKNAFFDEEAILHIDKEDSISNLEQQRQFLLRVVENLEKIGCLDELIDYENLNINTINSLLFSRNKIATLTKDSLIECIQNFDLTNSEDAIKMLIMNRQLTNKLTHNYEAFVIANIYMNTVNDKEFKIKQNAIVKNDDENIKVEIERKQRDLIKLYNKAKKFYNESDKDWRRNSLK